MKKKLAKIVILLMKIKNFTKCDRLKIICEWKWIMENEIYISLIVTLMEFIYKHKISLYVY